MTPAKGKGPQDPRPGLQRGAADGLVVHSAADQDRDGAGLVLHEIRRRFPRLDLIWAEGVYSAWQVDAAVERCRRCAWRSSSRATIRRALSSYRAAGWSMHLLLVRPQSASRQGLREPRRNPSHLRYPRLYPPCPQAARQGVGRGPRYPGSRSAGAVALFPPRGHYRRR